MHPWDMGEIRLRVPRQLQLFLRPDVRTDEVCIESETTSTIGHVIEAVGVPLTEVGSIEVDGASVPSSTRPLPGMVVELRPVTRPEALFEQARGFVLDVHLGTLARRMRLLGIDTAYRNDADDNELVDEANAERRILLTRDRRLLMRRALWWGAHVRGDRPDAQLADVIERFEPPQAPWTRCTACNGELRTVRKDDISHLLEPGTRRNYTSFAQCSACSKVYWRGAHSPTLESIVASTEPHPPAG